MKINLTNAIKHFFSNPSLEMVYIEAVANSIDAGATNIELTIKIDSFANFESLVVEIKDDGEGFNEKNFEKFKSLLDVEDEDKSHKGVGRLVFLNYFNKIAVKSIFDSQERTFEFTGTFDGENELKPSKSKKNETALTFKGYRKEKIKTYDYLKPESIKKSILQRFFPLLYSMKVEKKELKIAIKLETRETNIDQGFFTDTKELIVSQIPDMTLTSFDAPEIDMYEKLDMYYSIKEVSEEKSPITAICVDGRTHRPRMSVRHAGEVG